MIGQPTGHRWGEQHFSPSSLIKSFSSTQLMMWPAKIVGTAHQPHACLEPGNLTRSVPTPSSQARQPLAKGGIQAFNERGIQLRPSCRHTEQGNGCKSLSLRQTSDDLNHTLFGGFLDHCPDHHLWPGLPSAATSTCYSFDLFSKRSPNTVGVSCPAIRQDQHGGERLATGFHHLEQRIRQVTITTQADYPSQPQACRNHHRQTDPGNHFPSFPSNLIGLDMLEIELASRNLILMELLAMGASTFLPSRDRSLIQPQRMNNGLHRASISQERDDDHDQFFWLAQSDKHHPLASTKRLSARFAFIPRSLLSMTHQIPRFCLPPCRAVHIRAK